MDKLMVIEGGVPVLTQDAINAIAALEEQLDALKKAEASIKDRLLAEMEAAGVVKIDADNILISYVAPTERETFDSKAFRAVYPDVYDEYVKMTPVKASLRIKVR